MLRITLTILALFTLCPQVAVAQTIDPARSQITILTRQMNVPVEAVFKRFTAQLRSDPNQLERSSVRIEIDLNSLDIGDPEIIESVRERNWFDTKNHPQAVFIASSVRSLGSGRYEVRGPLTMKGRTHEVAAPFTIRMSGADRVFEGAFAIRRLQYNVGDAHWRDTSVVADEVQVKFRLYQPAAAR